MTIAEVPKTYQATEPFIENGPPPVSENGIAPSNAANQSDTATIHETPTPQRVLPRLEMFDPHVGLAYIQQTPFYTAVPSPRDTLRVIGTVRKAAKDDDPFLTPRGENLLARVDQGYYDTIAKIYDLAGDKDPKEFFAKQMKRANKAVEYMQDKVFPGMQDTIGLLDEVSMFSGRPNDMLQLLSRAHVSPRLRFELQRQLALGLVAAELDTQVRDLDLHSELNQLHMSISRKLYDGEIGGGRTVPTYAQHDNNTNAVVWLEGVSTPDQVVTEGAHWKLHRQHMREIKGTTPGDEIYVLNQKRVKEWPSAILKALKKTYADYEKDGTTEIDANKYVGDWASMLYVVRGVNNCEERKVDDVVDQVSDLVKEHYKLRGIAVELLPDDKTNGDKHQSNEVQFKRRQVKREGMPDIEIMFFTDWEFLNYRHSVGTWDTDERKYSGAGHPVYALARLRDLVDIMYPKEIYYAEPEDMDLKVIAEERMHALARDMKQADRSEVINPNFWVPR